MKSILAFIFVLLSAVFNVFAQGAGSNGNEEITATYVIGDITLVDAAKTQLQLKTPAGEFTILLSEKTKYLQLAPGETSIAKASPIELEKVSAGDRVLARGRVSVEQKTVQAAQIVLMKKEDISKRLERERDEWRKGIVGRITAIDSQTSEITVSVRAPKEERRVVLSIPANLRIRRYPPDAVKLHDARPSSFSELKIGDVVRGRGAGSPDGKRFTPEEIIAGSFRMSGGKITALDSAKGEIVINNILTKQPLTISVTPDSVVRRILPRHATLLMEGNSKEGGQEVVDSLPVISFKELKVGDTILISSTIGKTESKVTAIIVAAGAETIINAAQKANTQGNRGGIAASLGLSSNALDGAIGMP